MLNVVLFIGLLLFVLGSLLGIAHELRRSARRREDREASMRVAAAYARARYRQRPEVE